MRVYLVRVSSDTHIGTLLEMVDNKLVMTGPRAATNRERSKEGAVMKVSKPDRNGTQEMRSVAFLRFPLFNSSHES